MTGELGAISFLIQSSIARLQNIKKKKKVIVFLSMYKKKKNPPKKTNNYKH